MADHACEPEADGVCLICKRGHTVPNCTCNCFPGPHEPRSCEQFTGGTSPSDVAPEVRGNVPPTCSCGCHAPLVEEMAEAIIEFDRWEDDWTTPGSDGKSEAACLHLAALADKLRAIQGDP